MMHRLQHVADMARALLQEHGLSDCWTFRFDRSMKRAGLCHFGRKVISLSRHMVLHPSIDDAAVRNILLHEIAHALVGAEHGHGPHWQAKAKEIGCDGNRCHALAFAPPAAYTLQCPCGRVQLLRHRLRRAQLLKPQRCCGGFLTVFVI